VQQVGHGICGGFAPPNDFFPDLQLECKHGEIPHIAATGVIYRPDRPVSAPAVVTNETVEVGYAMEEIATSFWARRTEVGAGKTFASLVDFEGERCDVLACPKQFGGAFEGNRGESPSGPWNQEAGAGTKGNGSQFFDPAYTMSKRLTFPAGFSLDYCHNPYLGIVDRCATPSSAAPGNDAPGSDTRPPAAPSSATRDVDPAASSPANADERESGGCAMHGRSRAKANDGSALLVLASLLAWLRRGSSGSRRP
jgi:hypothetical protein